MSDMNYKQANKNPLFNRHMRGICPQNVLEFLLANVRTGYKVKQSVKAKANPEPVLTVALPDGNYELEISVDYNTIPGTGYWWYYLREKKSGISFHFGVISMEWQFKTTMKNLLTQLEKSDFETAT